MRHLDLFSGIGGFALAADRVFTDVEHIFCEIDPFCQEVLKNHWPNEKIYSNIPADSHVSHLAKPDEEKERKTTAISGRRCYELCESLLHYGSSLRMCVDSLLSAEVWYLNKCVLTWKMQGTKSNRLLFLLSPSTRLIEEIGSGLLATPATRDYKGAGKPETRIATGRNMQTNSLTDAVEVGTKTGLKLQPAFVEWMMGYPEDWTEIPDSKLLAMRLSCKSPKK